MQELFIKTTTGNTVTLDVEGSDTLDVVKAKIKDVVGECSLENGDIHWELMPKPKLPPAPYREGPGYMYIFIRILNGMNIKKTITLEVRQHHKISNLMPRIMRMEDILQYLQKFFFAGELLETDHTFAHYNICEGYTLDLVRALRGGRVKISVQTIDGKTIPLVIEEDYSIKKVKALIQEKTGIPPEQQRIAYAGDELDDNCDMETYYIQNESVLHLVGERTCVWMRIHVQIVATQKTFHLNVESTDTIHIVKAKIEEEEGIPISQQVLYLPIKQLQEDTFTLADYYIPNESTLYLAQFLGGK